MKRQSKSAHQTNDSKIARTEARKERNRQAQKLREDHNKFLAKINQKSPWEVSKMIRNVNRKPLQDAYAKAHKAKEVI